MKALTAIKVMCIESRLTDIRTGLLQFKSARSYPGLAQIISNEIPEIEYASRAYPEECLFKYGDKKLSGQKVLWVDDPFIKIFDIRLVKKTFDQPIKNTYTTVISESAAKRFFGNENPLGKTIILNEGVPFIINGIFEDYPHNSHVEFDFLLSMNTIGAIDGDAVITSIYYNWLYTYILLKPGSSVKEIEQKLTGVVEKHFSYLKDSNSKVVMFLQRLEDIHLKSNLSEEISANSNMSTIYYLSIIAFIILLMACINFINLSTARALERAKEVGMRKVVGANRYQVIKQFILESVLLNVIAFFISIAIVEMSLPKVNELISQNLQISIFASPLFWLAVFPIFFLSGIFAGLYPALLLSSFNPAVIIKGKFRNSGNGAVIRKALVVFQFAAAIALIICTLVITRQIEFVQNQHPGFDTEQVLCINSPRSLINNRNRVQYFERFKESLLNYPSINYVSASDAVPGREIVFHIENFTRLGSEPQNISFSAANVEWDFFRLLNIKFLAGRSFSKDFPTDSSAIVINESASAMLGFESPEEAVNNFVVDFTNGNQLKIIGIAANYHQEHFKKPVEPMIYFQGHNYQFGYFPVKINTKDLSGTINLISRKWEKVYPGDPLDFFFLNDFFNAQYKSDLQFGKTIMIFSLLAIIIASLGLFGLSMLVAVQRTKEIGIRKTLGASLPNLLYQLSRDFIVLVIIANALAWPIVYYTLNEWLNTFIIRINLNILFFLIPGFCVVIIATITMSFQILKVARDNPVDSLKYE